MPEPAVSVTITDSAIAVSPHHLATPAALDIMRSGGNVTDDYVTRCVG